MLGIRCLQNEDQKEWKKKSQKKAYSDLQVLLFLYSYYLYLISFLFPDFQKKLSNKHFKSYMQK